MMNDEVVEEAVINLFRLLNLDRVLCGLGNVQPRFPLPLHFALASQPPCLPSWYVLHLIPRSFLDSGLVLTQTHSDLMTQMCVITGKFAHLLAPFSASLFFHPTDSKDWEFQRYGK
jgi:hypothetical protein